MIASAIKLRKTSTVKQEGCRRKEQKIDSTWHLTPKETEKN